MADEVFGHEAKISRTSLSRICQRLQAKFDNWKRRDLSQSRIDYCCLTELAQDVPEGQDRARPRRMGDRYRRQASLLRSRPGRDVVRGCLDRAPHRPHRVEDVRPAARHLRCCHGSVPAIDRCFSASITTDALSRSGGTCSPRCPSTRGRCEGRRWASSEGIEGSGQNVVTERRRRARRPIARWKPLCFGRALRKGQPRRPTWPSPPPGAGPAHRRRAAPRAVPSPGPPGRPLRHRDRRRPPAPSPRIGARRSTPPQRRATTRPQNCIRSRRRSLT